MISSAKIFLSLLLGGLLGADPAMAAPTPGGAVAAMKAVPFKFKNGILEVVGKGGTPEPAEWILTARDADSMGTITRLTVVGGQVISQRPSGNIGQMFRESGFISPEAIKADSAAVFETAKKFARDNHGVDVVSVDYTLAKPAADLAAVWKLVCRDASGKVLGRMEVSSTNGSVMTQTGFKSAR